MDNDMEERIGMVSNLKVYPEKLVTKEDFGLDSVDWSNPTEDNLVQLYLYKRDLSWENIINTLRTGERIPAFVWCSTRLTEEFPMLSYEEIYDMASRGGEIENDRFRNTLSEEELTELDDSLDELEANLEDVFTSTVKTVLDELALTRELDEVFMRDDDA
jgi:hypothetical protein